MLPTIKSNMYIKIILRAGLEVYCKKKKSLNSFVVVVVCVCGVPIFNIFTHMRSAFYQKNPCFFLGAKKQLKTGHVT